MKQITMILDTILEYIAEQERPSSEDANQVIENRLHNLIYTLEEVICHFSPTLDAVTDDQVCEFLTESFIRETPVEDLQSW